MPRLHTLELSTPIFNSSSPWCSEIDQLEELYASPFTGAVTTRTATLEGFDQGPQSVHGHAFLAGGSSLNTYGYSPHPLSFYLDVVRRILTENPSRSKPFIISITSSDATELRDMLLQIQALRVSLSDDQASPSRIGCEINTSCPNIPHHPPPSYEPSVAFPSLLGPLLAALPKDLTLGAKLPPFTHIGQFQDMLAFLEGEGDKHEGKIAYLACCNTLGNCLGFESGLAESGPGTSGSVLDTSRFSGMAGAALHPLALGNVARFAHLLAASPSLSVRNIALVGIGGASDAEGVRRFFAAGATAVACATALGMKGVSVFEGMCV